MKFIRFVLLLAVVLGGVGYVLYLQNPAPSVPAISDADTATGKPYVVKLHAKWCPVCMLTKDVWSQIQETYSGKVNLLVLDFTNQASTDASRAEAKRLGLEPFFDEYAGTTGTVAVIDGRTRTVATTINGSRNFATYRSAIDEVLNRP
jgi:thiol-disulfide isomerase/thioredoxin